MKKVFSLSFLILFFSTSLLFGANTKNRKDYADYKDWQLQVNENFLLQEWETLELNYKNLTLEEYSNKVLQLKDLLNEEKEKGISFVYEDSSIIYWENLNNALNQLEKAILDKNEDKILEARTLTNIAIIDYENLQINIRHNSMKTIFSLFVSLLVILLLFIAATAIFAIRLRKSQENEQETSDFNQKILEVQENERKRLSLELHDTIAQNLRAIQLLTSKAFNLKENDSQLPELKQQVLELESKSILEIRTMCYNLTPPDLDRKDLKAALTHYCSTFKRDTGIECTLVITEDCNFEALTQENQLDIFRVIQESLTNVAKHSKAETASVILRNKIESNKKALIIIISDDGVGFIPEKVNSLDSHFGLRGIKERTKYLNGKIKINSEPGEGTEIRMEIPLAK